MGHSVFPVSPALTGAEDHQLIDVLQRGEREGRGGREGGEGREGRGREGAGRGRERGARIGGDGSGKGGGGEGKAEREGRGREGKGGEGRGGAGSEGERIITNSIDTHTTHSTHCDGVTVLHVWRYGDFAGDRESRPFAVDTCSIVIFITPFTTAL